MVQSLLLKLFFCVYVLTVSPKRGLKRKREQTDQYEFEEEVDNRQVTSTSVERIGKRQKKNSHKVKLHPMK